MRVVVFGKLLLGALPCLATTGLSFLALTNVIEQFVAPSKIFGRPTFTVGHVLFIALFICGVIGGLAGLAAWLKEWKRCDEPNAYLVGGLILGIIALAVANVAIVSATDFVWLLLMLPPFVIMPFFLSREIRAFRLRRKAAEPGATDNPEGAQ